MMQRGQRLLQIGRDAFLLRSLVGQDIHLLIRVWMTIVKFISTFSPYLAYLSYFISFPDSFIGGSLHPGGPCGTRGRDSDRQLLLLQAFLGCLISKGEKIQIKDFKSVLLSVLDRSDRC
jgi:hypothetical protein